MQENSLKNLLEKKVQNDAPVFNFSYPDLTVPKSLLHLRKIEDSFINIFKYPHYFPSSNGEINAREAISHYITAHFLKQKSEKIVITSTISESLQFLIKYFAVQDEQIVFPEIHSPVLEEILDFAEVKMPFYSLDEEFMIDLEKLSNQLEKNKNIKALYLPIPIFPTGGLPDSKKWADLIEVLAAHKIILLLDLSQAAFLFDHKLPPHLSLLENKVDTILVDTVTNTFALPGFKISWLSFYPASHSKNSLKIFQQAIEYYNDTFLTANFLSQSVLPEIFRYSLRWRQRFQSLVEKKRNYLVKKLSRYSNVKLHIPDGGFHLFLQINDTKLSSESLSVKLLEKYNLYIHPSNYYHIFRESGLVLSFLHEKKALQRATRRLQKFLKGLQVKEKA